MTEEDNSPTNEWSYTSQHEDKNVKLFNKVMRREGRRLELGISESDASEYDFLDGDVILIKPKNISLRKTAYGFFQKINVLTFFSNSENLGRSGLFFAIGRALLYPSNKYTPLNVMIVPAFPTKLFEFLNKQDEDKQLQQDPKHPWLWIKRYGLGDTALVVCSEVPLKKRFYKFLAFAPPNSDKWRRFVVKLAEENNQWLLKVVSQLHPTEYQQLAEAVKGLVSEKVLPAEVYQRMQAALSTNN